MDFKCPHCGKVLSESPQELARNGFMVLCPRCLSTFEPAGIDREAIEALAKESDNAKSNATQAANEPQQTTTYCHNCGCKLPVGMKLNYCPACGCKLQLTPEAHPLTPATEEPRANQLATKAPTEPSATNGQEARHRLPLVRYLPLEQMPAYADAPLSPQFERNGRIAIALLAFVMVVLLIGIFCG